jgi:hypothetical protein
LIFSSYFDFYKYWSNSSSIYSILKNKESKFGSIPLAGIGKPPLLYIILASIGSNNSATGGNNPKEFLAFNLYIVKSFFNFFELILIK